MTEIATVGISLVIPIYNCAHRVEAIVGSVLALNPQPAECIFVDDGSKDNTFAVTTRLLEGHPGYRVVTRPNGGPAAARNLGVAQASQPWVAFTDDDCEPHPDWLRGFEQAVATHPDCSCFFGKIEARGPVTPLHHYVENRGDGHQTANALYRRSALLEAGGFDECFPFPYLEDTDLFLRVTGGGKNWRFVPQAEVCHPSVPAGLWSRVRRTRYLESDYLLYAKNPELYRSRHRGAGPTRFHLYYIGLKHGLKMALSALLKLPREPRESCDLLLGLALERLYLVYLTRQWRRRYG